MRHPAKRIAGFIALLALVALPLSIGSADDGDLWWKPAPSQRECAKTNDLPLVIVDPAVKMRLVLIPAGAHDMGSPSDERQRRPDELLHRVVLPQPFYLSESEVTNEQYARLTPRHDSGLGRNESTAPAGRVTWSDATRFCELLTRSHPGDSPRLGFRLPTEAEWEYSCRAATLTARYWDHGPAPFDLEDHEIKKRVAFGWARVTTLAPNPWGLRGMACNAYEWCADWYGSYPDREVTDPTGPESGHERVARGGGIDGRSAERYPFDPTTRQEGVGFRVAATIVR